MNGSPFDNALLAATRALEEVIAPALDPGNPLANEQLQLVVRYLRFIRERAGQVAAKQRRELDCALALGERILSLSPRFPQDILEGLDLALPQARELLDSAHPREGQIPELCQRINALISAAVRFSGQLDPATRQAIEKSVLALSRPALELQRAWLSPLQLDPEPSTIAPIESLLR